MGGDYPRSCRRIMKNELVNGAVGLESDGIYSKLHCSSVAGSERVSEC